MEMTQIDSMTFIVKIDGKEIPVPEEIGGNDTAVRAALSPFYPGASNADLKRTVNGNTTTIDVLKKAGKLGLLILNVLDQAPSYEDPAVKLAIQLNAELEKITTMSADQMRWYEEGAGKAISDSQANHLLIDRAYSRLCASAAEPSRTPVAGF